MENKYLFKNSNSCIAIRDERLYVLSTRHKDYSPRAVQIIPGFQMELGRNIEDFKQALKQTRLPIIIKLLVERGTVQTHQIIRMHTGNVDDKVVANIQCENGVIKIIAFNRALMNDSNYRRYNQLSAYSQLSLPCNLSISGCTSRSEQVRKTISAITMVEDVEVKENGKKLTAKIKADEQNMYFNFICAGEYYILSNISI